MTAEERAEQKRRAALAAKIAAVLAKNTLHILMCGGMLTRREKKS